MYHAIITAMHWPPQNNTLRILLFALALCAPATLHADDDPRLIPWLEAAASWGRGPGGEALWHALDASRRHLPQARLREALSEARIRPTDPYALAARDQLLAALDREAGDLDAAQARTASQGYVLDWEIVLPERLAGIRMWGDPASGWVSPADHARFSGVETVLLEARIQLRNAGNILVLAGGDGVAAVRAGGQENVLPISDASLLDQATLCAALPAGPATLRLELRPHRSARSFAVRLARPDGRPFSDAARLVGRPEECTAGPLERWDSGLSKTLRSPGGEVAGLWLQNRVGRISRPSDALLDALRPASWLDLDLLADLLSDQRQRWEAVCARIPWCAGGWPAEVLRAELEFRRGQSYRPLQRLRSLEDRIPSRDSGGQREGHAERARLLRADLLHGLGLVHGAVEALGVLGEDASPELRDARVNLAIAAGAREMAIDILTEEHRRRPGALDVGGLLASLLTDAGRLDEVARLLESLQRLHPADPDLLIEKARTLSLLGRVDEGLALLDGLQQRAGANPSAWEQRGRILERAGRDSEAATAWRRALELEPHNPDIQAMLRKVSPGHHRNWAGLRRSLGWAMAQTGEGGDGHVVEGLADLRLVTIHTNGLLTIHRQQVLRVVDAGVDGELSLSALYDPHTEDLTTLNAAILRKGGEVLQAPDGDDLSLSQEEFNLHYDLRERVRYFPRLMTGDVVVWETRLDQFRGARGGVSLVRYLQEPYPKRLVEIGVSVPKGIELRHSIRLSNGESTTPPERTEDGDAVLYRWRLEDLPALIPRPLPPPAGERSAHMVLSTMHSWRHIAEWYGTLLSQQTVETPEMTALADAMADDPDGPIAAAARFVADQVRYVGLEFGVNAYVPYPTSRVFERRYGDCKDKSLLMVTLLRRLGVEAHLALVRTFPYGALPDPPPSISLFDHAIVRIPEADIWFDPTARYLGTSGLPWQNQGAQVLVLDGDPSLETIPIAPAAENRTDVRIILQDGDGGLRVSGTGRFTGAQARANFELVRNPTEWEDRVERFIARILPGFRLMDAPWESRDASPPTLRMEVDGVVETDGAGTLGVLAGLRFQPGLAGLTQRSEDLLLHYPFEERYVLQADTPKVEFSGPGAASGEGPGCHWTLVTEPTRVEVEVSLGLRRILAEDYPAFRACLGALDTALAQVRTQLQEGP